MKWNVFSLEAVKTALEPKFVLEKVRYVTDDEEYGEGKSTRFVFRNVEEMPEIDHIERTISTFIRDTYVHFKDKNIKPMCLRIPLTGIGLTRCLTSGFCIGKSISCLVSS